MKRRGALIVAVVAGAAALIAVFAATGSADHPGSTTLTFVERDNQGTFHFIDNKPKSTRRGEPSVSPGDMFLGSNPLYNAANTRREGKLFFKCTAILPSKRFARSTFQCEATVKLSNGTLAISVLFKGGNPGGPVIGGTGAYEGASGSFTSDDRRRSTVDTLHFDTD
jgi:hypothetical protein